MGVRGSQDSQHVPNFPLLIISPQRSLNAQAPVTERRPHASAW